MKQLLFFIFLILGIQLNAQVSYSLVSNTTLSETEDLENNLEFVQKVIAKNPIHVHPDSISKGFTICWNGPKTTYMIIGPNNKIKKEGIIITNTHISTKRWKGGRYVLRIDDEIEIIMLMRK
jgi:hypothetical protein